MRKCPSDTRSRYSSDGTTAPYPPPSDEGANNESESNDYTYEGPQFAGAVLPISISIGAGPRSRRCRRRRQRAMLNSDSVELVQCLRDVGNGEESEGGIFGRNGDVDECLSVISIVRQNGVHIAHESCTEDA